MICLILYKSVHIQFQDRLQDHKISDDKTRKRCEIKDGGKMDAELIFANLPSFSKHIFPRFLNKDEHSQAVIPHFYFIYSMTCKFSIKFNLDIVYK